MDRGSGGGLPFTPWSSRTCVQFKRSCLRMYHASSLGRCISKEGNGYGRASGSQCVLGAHPFQLLVLVISLIVLHALQHSCWRTTRHGTPRTSNSELGPGHVIYLIYRFRRPVRTIKQNIVTAMPHSKPSPPHSMHVS